MSPVFPDAGNHIRQDTTGGEDKKKNNYSHNDNDNDYDNIMRMITILIVI